MIPADKVAVACPECFQRFAVARVHLGKQGRCPSCQQVFAFEEPKAVLRESLFTPPPPQQAPVSEEQELSLEAAESDPRLAYERQQARNVMVKAIVEEPLTQRISEHDVYISTSIYSGITGGAVCITLGVILAIMVNVPLGLAFVGVGVFLCTFGWNRWFTWPWEDLR